MQNGSRSRASAEGWGIVGSLRQIDELYKASRLALGLTVNLGNLDNLIRRSAEYGASMYRIEGSVTVQYFGSDPVMAGTGHSGRLEVSSWRLYSGSQRLRKKFQYSENFNFQNGIYRDAETGGLEVDIDTAPMENEIVRKMRTIEKTIRSQTGARTAVTFQRKKEGQDYNPSEAAGRSM